MSRRDPKSLTESVTMITRGVNSGLPPVSLGRDQLAWAVNATFRNGYAQPRPGITRCILDLDNLDTPANFTTGIYQGAIGFERRNQLVVTIGGRLYRIDPDTWTVTDISTTDLNPSNRYRAWLAEAEDFIIIQDGQSAPWFYDGSVTRRSDTFGIGGRRQVPAGTAMVFSSGRLLTCLQDNRQFVVGDLTGADSGTVQYAYRDSVLYLTENDTLDGGGAFSVPINAGELTAFRPIAQIDTSTGQGPTQVFTTGGVFSLNAPTDRTAWATVTFPIGTVSMISGGSTSDRATVNVNGDLWFRSLDGIRSFMVARRDFNTWVNTPMSQEVTRALATDDRNLLGYASAAVFDNRLLMTVNPYRVWDHGICHRGLVVLDFAPVAYLNVRTPPAWEGLWTGVQVLQVLSCTLSGRERCFIFGYDETQGIQLWEISKDRVGDSDGVNDFPIEWSPETCGLNFPRRDQPSPVLPGSDLQRLENGQLFVDEIQGTVTFTLSYRADQDPCWHDWHSWSVCATDTLCPDFGSQECITPQVYERQYRQPFRLPNLAYACDPSTNKPYNVGAEFQVKLAITGQCRLKRLEVIAYDQQEDANGQCAATETCTPVYCDCQNDYDYSIPIISSTPTGGAPPDSPPAVPPDEPVVDPVTEVRIGCDPADPECWMSSYGGTVYIGSYGFTKVTDSPSADGITLAMTTFWQALLSSEIVFYGGVLPPGGVWAWDWVDPFSSNIDDFAAKYATGIPTFAEGDPTYSPVAYWRLIYVSP